MSISMLPTALSSSMVVAVNAKTSERRAPILMGRLKKPPPLGGVEIFPDTGGAEERQALVTRFRIFSTAETEWPILFQRRVEFARSHADAGGKDSA